MPAQLTEKQAAVLAFIAEFTAREKWSPTRQDIARHFGWKSINAADEHVKALIRKGRLRVRVGGWHAHRNLQVASDEQV